MRTYRSIHVGGVLDNDVQGPGQTLADLLDPIGHPTGHFTISGHFCRLRTFQSGGSRARSESSLRGRRLHESRRSGKVKLEGRNGYRLKLFVGGILEPFSSPFSQSSRAPTDVDEQYALQGCLVPSSAVPLSIYQKSASTLTRTSLGGNFAFKRRKNNRTQCAKEGRPRGDGPGGGLRRDRRLPLLFFLT